MPILAFSNVGLSFGAALILFRFEGTPLSAVPGEAYRLATSPMLPAIPSCRRMTPGQERIA